MRIRPILPALFPSRLFALAVAVGLFAGCFHANDNREEEDKVVAALWIRPDGCSGRAQGFCTVTADSIQVLDATIRARDGEDVGIYIEDPGRPVLLQRVDLRDFRTGMVVSASCPTCSVAVADSRVEGRWTILQIGGDGVVEGPVTIEHSDLVSQPPSDPLLLADNATWEGPTGPVDVGPVFMAANGILIGDHPGGLALDAVVLRGDLSYPAGTAIKSQRPELALRAALDARNVSIEGFPDGIEGNWSRLELRDTEVWCRHEAVYQQANTEVFIDGLRVHDCATGTHPWCGVCTAVRIGRPQDYGGTATLRNVEIRGGEVGLATSYDSFNLESFVIADANGTGLRARSADGVTLTDGRIEQSGWIGAFIVTSRLSAEGIAVTGNGWGAPANGSTGGVQIVPVPDPVFGSITVHGSSFLNNRGCGLQLVGKIVDGVFDARLNWWGHEMGPSISPLPGLCGPFAVPLGDGYSGPGPVVPFLTSPP